MDRRLLPDGFLAEYRRCFGGDPPVEFLEAYELLAESLYWGAGKGEVSGVRKGVTAGDWFFADPRLLATKFRSDKVLAAAASGLQRWRRRSEAPRRPAAPGTGGADLPGARGEGGRA